MRFQSNPKAVYKSIHDKVKDFYFGPLMETFPKKAETTLSSFFRKHLFEVSVILAKRENGMNGRASLLDVGGGMGINAIILTKLFSSECCIIDRLAEFSPEHNRVVGNRADVINRLKEFNVKIDERNFIEDGFHYPPGTFDIITCFDVIEHLPFSPRDLVRDISMLLKSGGTLLLGTPNQVHFYNRAKVLFGKNIWEDFEYYYSIGSDDCFFGHVREFTPSELKLIVKRESSVEFVESLYSNYPVQDRLFHHTARFIPSKLLDVLIDTFTALLPELSYYMIAVSQKK